MGRNIRPNPKPWLSQLKAQQEELKKRTGQQCTGESSSAEVSAPFNLRPPTGPR